MQKVFEKIKCRLEEHNLKLKSMRNTCIALSDKEVCDIENYAYATAIKIVDQVAKEYNNGWIPCSERLPYKRGPYLVCSKNVIWIADYYLDTWWGIHHRCRWTDVEAWMPLPEPYKLKGESHCKE